MGLFSRTTTAADVFGATVRSKMMVTFPPMYRAKGIIRSTSRPRTTVAEAETSPATSRPRTTVAEAKTSPELSRNKAKRAIPDHHGIIILGIVLFVIITGCALFAFLMKYSPLRKFLTPRADTAERGEYVEMQLIEQML